MIIIDISKNKKNELKERNENYRERLSEVITIIKARKN